MSGRVQYFRHLHWVLFQDVYEWAGKYRDIDISKGDSRFCHCSFIERELIQQLKRIPTLNQCVNRDAFIHLIADIFCEINIIHPFREGEGEGEGNGRATRFFFEELVFVAGYELDWPEISKEKWIEANVHGYHGDLSLLESIFDMAIS
ncbi:Fic family protein [Vibrio mangrovi]|uniref:protein adenylyltransferase n=1 Tax=Vibrio mangrovi TaxID=474394 RepID=A0ABU4I1X6_9VIBR|nr:Fic family protein [Vibrio mangrovi]MDW6001940.1 Fic family protein [Vibrio mangrovi]